MSVQRYIDVIRNDHPEICEVLDALLWEIEKLQAEVAELSKEQV